MSEEELACLELISCNELAQVLHSGATEKVLIVDCRSFLEFNTGNIVNSVNVCCSKLVKRRLQQNKVPIEEFLSQTCHVDVGSDHEIVLCDQCTTSPHILADDNLVVILARRCLASFRRVSLLVGGFIEFQSTHPSLCETKSVVSQAVIGAGHCGSIRAGSPMSAGMTSSLSQPCLPVANVGPTKILPYLFLGSQQDAMSAELAQVNGITYVLNVSLNCPKPPHIQDGHFLRIPVNDNYSEKLLPYFHDAFQFLDKVREGGACALVHCLAGISRSPTLAIAYIMRCYHMTSEEAYRYVKDKRPTISPNFNFLGQLLEYEHQIETESCIPGNGHKRRCLDDLRAVGTAASALTSSSPLATPLTPLSCAAMPGRAWCFPPKLLGVQRPADCADRLLPCSNSAALTSEHAATVAPLRPPNSRQSVAASCPSSLALPGLVAGLPLPPQQPYSASSRRSLTLARGVTVATSQQSPTAALANLRFESSIAAAAGAAAAVSTASGAPTVVADLPAHIGRFPTVYLSELSFTPCLVAPHTAAVAGEVSSGICVGLPSNSGSAKAAGTRGETSALNQGNEQGGRPTSASGTEQACSMSAATGAETCSWHKKQTMSLNLIPAVNAFVPAECIGASVVVDPVCPSERHLSGDRELAAGSPSGCGLPASQQCCKSVSGSRYEHGCPLQMNKSSCVDGRDMKTTDSSMHRRAPPQRPSSITILSCGRPPGPAAVDRSTIACIVADPGPSESSRPLQATAVSSACVAPSAVTARATPSKADPSISDTTQAHPFSSSIAFDGFTVKLSSARTVPSDLHSIVTATADDSLWAAAAGSEMSPCRKSRSLEDILTSPDWEAATKASGMLSSTCRCLRRRSAVLVFSGDAACAGFTQADMRSASAHDCRCGAGPLARDTDPPRPSSGSIASTSSSGSRATSLHSSLEMIQVS